MTVKHPETSAGPAFAPPTPAVNVLAPRRICVGFARDYQADLAASALLLVVSAVLTLLMVMPVQSFTRGDWPTQFFPTYAYLGERLRAFDIPGWNPHQFSGAPFAGDPESGWMYLPAMLLYTVFPAEPATAIYIGLHIFAAGLAVYVLARLLGLSAIGSLIGGASYAFAWVAPASSRLTIWFPVTVWLIVALIGIELAERSESWTSRLWSWLLAALAISQILAVWLGQASYYALLVIGAWIAYRTLLIPDQSAPIKTRVVHLLRTGLVVFALAFGLAAPGLLPRLDAVSRSNLAGGVYDVASSWEEAQTGLPPSELLYELVGGFSGSLWWYAGAVAVTLAVLAPVVARSWRPMPFWVLVSIASLALALDTITPLHTVFNLLLPRFEELHVHAPYRVLILFGPAVALLAAATVTYLPRWEWSRAALAALAAVPAILTLVLAVSPSGPAMLLSREVQILIVAISALLVCYALIPQPRVRHLAVLGLLVLALWDPAGRLLVWGFADASNLEPSLQSSLGSDPAAFLHANGAADFLLEQTASEPGRYAGFAPRLLPDPATIETQPPRLGYRSVNSLKQPVVNWLLVYNWATWFGLDDIQGYNPVQIRRYVEYIDAINGHRQEYHERDLFPAGLESPLLDLLNLRYLIVDSRAPGLYQYIYLPIVYADDYVRILKNPEALPRAWLVHEAQQVAPGEALDLLADRAIDPLQTALLESPPPSLTPAPDPNAESARYVAYEPDRIEIAVDAAAPGLLILSEAWDPGWSATVDGQPAPVLLADHILRAVPVPSGQHSVELRYEPPYLRAGLLLAGLSLLAVAAALVYTSAARSQGRLDRS